MSKLDGLPSNPHKSQWEQGKINPAFSKGYKHPRGGPVSNACGDGRHFECDQNYSKCHCTVRSGHNDAVAPHVYVSPSAPSAGNRGAVDSVPGISPALTTAPAQGAEEFMIEIARELYDRFVMGGWEPQDAYPWLSWLLGEVTAAKDREIALLKSELEKRDPTREAAVNLMYDDLKKQDREIAQLKQERDSWKRTAADLDKALQDVAGRKP